MKILPSLLLFVALLSGCATIDPYSREEKTSNLVKGAAIGALGGAAIGAIAGKGKGALIGAAAGAAAGSGVGYYMDVQEAKLRQQLEGTGVGVQRQGNNLILVMPGNITFASNSSDINQSFYSVLNSVLLVLKEFSDTSLDIIGFTDSTGNAKYNQSLSEKRAGSVAGYLINQNINPARIAVQGLGERYPIASNNTLQGRSLNRRVELKIRPVG